MMADCDFYGFPPDVGDVMGSALKIRDDLTPLELRRWALVESYGRAAARAYGIANALEEMPRADAARLAGMDRQTLRDAVVVTMQRDWRGFTTVQRATRRGG